MDQNHEKLTKSKDRSEGKLGLFWWDFRFYGDRRKIGGKFVINRALDTNMLGGNPGVGPIFHEFHEKRGESGGRGKKGMKTTNTRTQNTHAHTNTHTPKSIVTGN